jgi:hypothetical protein
MRELLSATFSVRSGATRHAAPDPVRTGSHRQRRERTVRRRTTWIVGGVMAAAMLGGTGMSLAAAGGDDQPLTGSTLERAVAAALAETGGGTVTETEVGDGGAAYSVEVRLADGRQVEVQLDRDFRVTGREADDDGRGDRDGGSDG